MNVRTGTMTREGERLASSSKGLAYLPGDPPEPGHAREIAPGVHWMRVPLPMDLNHINLWLLDDDDGWTVVDTGLDDEVCRDAWLSLERVALRGLPLKRVFVTHDHPDHMGLARWLAERHGAAVWMSGTCYDSSSEFLRTPPATVAERMAAFLRRHGLVMTDAAGTKPRDHRVWFGREPPPLAQRAADGDRIAAGGDWRLIETGGHCRGHLCLNDAGRRILISGDQVLPTISPNVSVMAHSPEANPLRDFLASLERLDSCDPQTVVLPSHGRPFVGLQQRTADLRRHHEQQLDALREFCREPRAAVDVLPVMFRRVLRGFHQVLAVGEAIAHLHLLRFMGQIERIDDADGLYRFVRSR
jgi:glyoxylase-like metal-dependent hydrolase (beta-lactamase superfamily II)